MLFFKEPTIGSIIVITTLVSLVAVAHGQGQKETSAQESSHDGDNHQPAPEPYSFSYSSESVGGQSTHQESGDGSGRVTGFYTIMGEDGRERRVDYVADENGYRASVSTNEVGVRSESSADAQYNARLPSDKQLEQAKVSAEQYQYLEETHAAERERHLARLNSKEQNFQHNSQWSTNHMQSQQQRFQPNQQPQQQQQSSWSAQRQQVATGQRPQSTQSFNLDQVNSNQGNNNNNNVQPINNQQQLQTGFNRGSSSGSSSSSLSTSNPSDNTNSYETTNQSNDSDWQGRSNYLAGSRGAGQAASWTQKFTDNRQQSGDRLQLGQQQQQQPQQQQSQAPLVSTESSSALSSQTTGGSGARQTILGGSSMNDAGGQQLAQQFGPSATYNNNNNFSSQPQPQQQRLDGVQQFQQAAWMMANRGGVPTRRPTTVLQKQLEAQFMQQAQQLTDQDYPRQSNFNNQQFQRFNSGQQAQPQPQPQQQQQQQQQQFLISNQQPTSGLNQIDQQQANIIDEPVGEQVDQGAGLDQQLNVVAGGSKATSVGGANVINTPIFSQQEQSKGNNKFNDVQPTTTSKPTAVIGGDDFGQKSQAYEQTVVTNNQSVPTGFVSIPLTDQNQNQNQNNQFQEQNLDQEVDQRPYSTVAPIQQQQAGQIQYNQSVTSGPLDQQQQQVDGQIQTGDIQQVVAGGNQEQQQQQQQLEEISSRPDSIKQIIEQQKATKQAQQQFSRPTGPILSSRPTITTTTTTTTSTSTTTTTTPAPTTIYQTTSTPQVIVDTTRTPVYVSETTTPRQVVYVQPSTTSTTSTTSQRPVPVEVITQDYRPVVVDTTTNLPTRRPLQQQQQQQQQQQVFATKGGSQNVRQNARYNPRPVNATKIALTPNQRPINTNNYYNEAPRTTYRPIVPTTDISREIPKVPIQVTPQRQPISSPYGLQQQQQPLQQTGYQSKQPLLSSQQTNVTRPVRIEYQQQQPIKNTKGGSSKVNKRQFWLNQQQQQQPLGRLNSTATASNFQSNSLVGVDYANTDFGTRVASRLR